MADIKIILNGEEIIVQEGMTILEVAQERGIDIPTLCHDEYLKPFGSCWICLVEVKGARGFVPSCATKVYEGMEVNTDSKEVREARKMALELLLSDHYADCTAPCILECPARVDVQGYIALVHDGLYHEAVELIKKRLPFPLSVGRVCPAFCEKECRRQIIDEPVAIRQIKRFAADKDLEDAAHTFIPECKSSTGKRVAIVGAGPAGLSVAYYLAQQGHKCIVYEAMAENGGMLRYGIPEYRLPKEVLDKEIDLIKKLGVEIHNNVRLGKDFTLEFLYKEYDAIFLGFGAWTAVSMNIEGEELEGCYLGIDFLRMVTEGELKKVGKRVAVIGGGNTAIDAARTALRLGAEKVMIVYRRAEEQMPADEVEVKDAKDEGVEFHLLQNPTKIIGKDGKVEGMQVIKMRLGEPDSSGRRRPVPIENSEFIMQVDMVIPAVSQKPDTQFLLDDAGMIQNNKLNLTRWSTIEVDEKTMCTNIDKIFAGGDLTRGPSTVIESIADAYTAAQSIDKFLNGKKIQPLKEKFNSKKAESYKDIPPEEYEEYEKIKRFKPNFLPVKDRITNFKEVEQIFTEEEVKKETARCIECGCDVNYTCDLRKYATDYDAIATRYIGMVNNHPIDKTHPFILRDANKCVNCGRCVRTCLEIQGVGALGYIYRGFGTLVAPEFGESLLKTSCKSCGKCIDVCPVGALTSRNTQYKLAPLDLEKVETTCALCGAGCKVAFYKENEVILKAEAGNSPITQNNVCFNAHFGYEVLRSDERITQPMLRKGNELKPVDWKEAVDYITDKFTELERKVAFFSNGNFTNEELYLIGKLAKQYKDEKKFSWELNGSVVHDQLGINYSPNPTSDFEKTQLIVLIGDVTHTVGVKIIQAQKEGAKLMVLHPGENRFTRRADYHIQSNYYIEIINEFAKYLVEYRHHNIDYIVDCIENFVDFNHQLQHMIQTEEFEEFARELIQYKKVIFVYSESDIDYDTQNAIFNLSMLRGNIGAEGNGLVTCSELANMPYLKKMGFEPVKNYSRLKAAAIFGEDPLFNNRMEAYEWLNNLEFLLVADSYMTETAKMAHVLLPLNSFIETQGMITNDNNVVQKVEKVITTATGKENWFVLRDLLGMDISFEKLSEEANKDNPYRDESHESRYSQPAEMEKKIHLLFTHKPSTTRSTILLNNTRKRIADFKKELLEKV
ncbi:MAG TPA: FAD-dependent oxidoreductase [Candidatus Cloacimonetes bacterium]|nr:FAD-dependent oxidoreductase [Candidatus Cloacimonadota bacterium]HEX37427.1 FAD-dependent oxidoreductase [Candidatus Cloacimonadota bacterium]